jgi:raffinose/stachyose/melibiose transport system substrate-binding protein
VKRIAAITTLLVVAAALSFASGAGEASPAAEDAGFTGEIVVSIANRAETENAINALGQAYKAIYPGADVIFEPAVGGDYNVWLGTQLASGNIRPDVVMGNYQPTYDRYVDFDRYRYTTNPHTGNTWEQDLDFDFFAYRNERGERVMVATQAVHVLWFYNKTVFDSLGLDPPADWPELVEVADALADAGHTPLASNYTYMIPQWIVEIYWDQFNRYWHEIVRAKPGDYNYDDALDGEYEFDPLDPKLGSNYNYNNVRFYRGILDGVIRWDTPEFVDMITQFTQVFNRHVNDDVYVQTDPYPRFLQGNAAMMVNGAWMIPTLRLDMESLDDADRRQALNIGEDADLQAFEWGTFPMPSMTGPNVDGPARSVESAYGEYISVIDKNQAQTDLTMNFVQFWLSKPGYQAYVDGAIAGGTNYFPRGPIVIRGVELPGNLEGMYDDIEFRGNAERPINNFVGHPGYPSFFQQSTDLFKLVLDGDITPAEYAERRQQMIEDNFEEMVELAGLTMENLDDPARNPAE